MERKRIHTRTIVVEVYDEGDGTISVEGNLEDVQPPESGYWKGDRRPGDKRPPGILHKMSSKMRIDQKTSEIVATGGDFPGSPYNGCTAVIGWLNKLEGLKIAPGYSQKSKDLLGGPKGCAHMNTLLQVMANTKGASGAYFVDKGRGNEEMKKQLEAMRSYTHPAVNSCHMWRMDGPLMQNLKDGKPPIELDL